MAAPFCASVGINAKLKIRQVNAPAMGQRRFSRSCPNASRIVPKRPLNPSENRRRDIICKVGIEAAYWLPKRINTISLDIKMRPRDVGTNKKKSI